MLVCRFEEFADPDSLDLYPEPLRAEIDELNERIYDAVNNGVYKAGFTTNQDVYEREVADIFAMLDELDERLGSQRFLFGELPVETDWRLFTTLLRFDAVYYIHFKCSPAAARRLPEPLALRARPLPVAGHRRDGALRRHPPPLLLHASDDQPVEDRRRAARRRLERGPGRS